MSHPARTSAVSREQARKEAERNFLPTPERARDQQWSLYFRQLCPTCHEPRYMHGVGGYDAVDCREPANFVAVSQ